MTDDQAMARDTPFVAFHRAAIDLVHAVTERRLNAWELQQITDALRLVSGALIIELQKEAA